MVPLSLHCPLQRGGERVRDRVFDEFFQEERQGDAPVGAAARSRDVGPSHGAGGVLQGGGDETGRGGGEAAVQPFGHLVHGGVGVDPAQPGGPPSGRLGGLGGGRDVVVLLLGGIVLT